MPPYCRHFLIGGPRAVSVVGWSITSHFSSQLSFEQTAITHWPFVIIRSDVGLTNQSKCRFHSTVWQNTFSESVLDSPPRENISKIKGKKRSSILPKVTFPFRLIADEVQLELEPSSRSIVQVNDLTRRLFTS